MITWEKARALMRKKGLTSYYIKKNKIMAQSTYNRLMHDKPINTETIDKLCGLLDCTPMDLMTYRKDSE